MGFSLWRTTQRRQVTSRARFADKLSVHYADMPGVTNLRTGLGSEAGERPCHRSDADEHGTDGGRREAKGRVGGGT